MTVQNSSCFYSFVKTVSSRDVNLCSLTDINVSSTLKIEARGPSKRRCLYQTRQLHVLRETSLQNLKYCFFNYGSSARCLFKTYNPPQWYRIYLSSIQRFKNFSPNPKTHDSNHKSPSPDSIPVKSNTF
jgi:hypothetical protein